MAPFCATGPCREKPRGGRPIHPLLVNLPILSVLLGLGVDLLVVVAGPRRRTLRLGAVLWLVAGLGAGAAFYAGYGAAAALPSDNAAAQRALGSHHVAAELSLGIVVVAAALRLALTGRLARGGAKRLGLLLVAVELAAAGSIVVTAHRGGAVHREHRPSIPGRSDSQ